MLQFADYTIDRQENPFQWAPTLGGECYDQLRQILKKNYKGFNGHPPLGVNATYEDSRESVKVMYGFQWAPTLGGECYRSPRSSRGRQVREGFNGHPPLGVNATHKSPSASWAGGITRPGFNGHPPLGVNATLHSRLRNDMLSTCFNGHPPLGVNATALLDEFSFRSGGGFQWAPTLGGECYSCIPPVGF